MAGTKTAMVQKPPRKPAAVQTEMSCTDAQLAGILQALGNDRPYTILAKEWTGLFCEWSVFFHGDDHVSHVIHSHDKWVIKP
jgi:hypothetical protein